MSVQWALQVQNHQPRPSVKSFKITFRFHLVKKSKASNRWPPNVLHITTKCLSTRSNNYNALEVCATATDCLLLTQCWRNADATLIEHVLFFKVAQNPWPGFVADQPESGNFRWTKLDTCVGRYNTWHIYWTPVCILRLKVNEDTTCGKLLYILRSRICDPPCETMWNMYIVYTSRNASDQLILTHLTRQHAWLITLSLWICALSCTQSRSWASELEDCLTPRQNVIV
jgi:hypothetical protein